MLVHIDGIIFRLQSHGGISSYFRELLTRLEGQVQPTLLSLETPLQAEPPPGMSRMRIESRTARMLERYRPCRAPGSGRASVFHSSYYRLPEQRSLPTVVTVHDFAYERTVHGPRAWLHSAQKKAAIRQAQAIVCVSEATRDDLLACVGVRASQSVHVIYNGVSDDFKPMAPVASGDASPPFILYVGQRGGYKNFALALAALALLPGLELHCVGGGPLQPAELAAVSAGTRARMRQLGAVSNQVLNTCYNQAQCLLYPSAYEGFGIPVIEAMRAGCPVVSIACKAVQEVGGQALTVAEATPGGLANAVLATLQAAHRSRVRALGLARAQQFSWDRNFSQTLAVYRSLAAT